MKAHGLCRVTVIGSVCLAVVAAGAWFTIGTRATHVPLPTMAVDTDITGNTYTADPSAPADTNNQDNRIVSGTVEPCSLLALPSLGATATRTVDVLLANSPNTIATDIRLILRDSAGATIDPNFSEIVSFNATPFSDNTQDTDLDGDPPPASGGTGSDAAQPVGFLNLPVDPTTVGSMAPASAGGPHRAVSFFTQPPSPIPAGTVNAYASATFNGTRDLHVSADHPHSGTEVENGVTAPYVANSTNGVTVFRATVRVKNLAAGANNNPFFVRLDLVATIPGFEPGAAIVHGNDLNADGDFGDPLEEENNNLPEANLADGGLQVGGAQPDPCPPIPPATPTPLPTPTVTPAGTPIPTATPTTTPIAGSSTMAVDTDIAGNTYTANPSAPGDTNNQDNRIVSGTIEPCSLLALPALGATSNRTVDVLLANSPNTIATDIRLILRDSGNAVIDPNFAEIVSFNATPFSDNTQDTDLDGDPPPASGGTGGDAAQPVGFLNLPVDPTTVGTLAPGSVGGLRRAVSFFTGPGSPLPAGTVNSFASATYNGTRNLHVSADHPHNGTEVENGSIAPYVANSASGVTIFRTVIRVKNLAAGANNSPFFVRLDLAASIPFPGEPGAAVVLGHDLNADGDFSDPFEEENKNLPEANLADGGLQVGGSPPDPCPPIPPATPTPTPTPTITPTPTPTITATPCPQCTPMPTATATPGPGGFFNPTSSTCFTTATNPDAATCDGNSAPGARSNILTTFEIPADDYNFAQVISFTPSAFTVPAATDLPLGAIVGRLNSIPTLGLINGPCASILPVNFTFMNASVNINDTIDPLPFTTTNNLQNLAQGANGIPAGAVKYPSYLNTLFQHQQPRARYFAATSLPFASGLWVILQLVIFEPGASPNTDILPPLDPMHGYPGVIVLQDPTAPPAVSAITDFCSSLKVRAVINGESEDNVNTPDNDAGLTVRQNPGSDGTYNFVTWARSQRDADGDGLENALDTCPYVPNIENPRRSRAQGGDPDLDGIDSACDDNAGAPCQPTATDCDGDQYANRQDNCPLVFNPAQTDADLVFGPLPVGDDIGDACDQAVGTLDGHYHVTGPCFPTYPPGCEPGGPTQCLISPIQVGAGGTPDATDVLPCGPETPGVPTGFSPAASACFTTATNPDTASCDGNSASGAKSNILSTFEIPRGDFNFSQLISFTPSEFTVPAAADVALGAIVGRLNSLPTLGLINGPCASLLPVNFTLMNASVNINDTIDPLPFGSNPFQNLAQDGNSNGLQDGLEKYPSYLNTIFRNQQPRARYVGFTSLSFAQGFWVVLQFVIFEPGTSPNPDILPPLDASHGYPSVTVLQNPAAPPSIGTITDFCAELDVRAVINGESEDNVNTPENDAGRTVRQNPVIDGNYNLTTWARSQRDADGDGLENPLDTCPYDPNVEDPRIQAPDGDPDFDGIDSACDPNPGAPCQPTATDCDGDGYANRQDNCPLVFNPSQTDADFVFAGPLPVGEGIGDACDQNVGELDGPNIELCLVSEVPVGAGGVPPPTDSPPCVPGGPPPPPPTNDDFGGASVIGSLPFSATQNTATATFQSGEPSACAPMGATVWYAFTPAENMRIAADTFGSSFDTVLAAYTGTSLFTLFPVACNDQFQGDQSRIIFSATAGTTYYFQIGGFFAQRGDLVFSVDVGPPPLEVTVNLASTGSVIPKDGTATVSGTVTCSQPAFVDLSGELSQQVARATVSGFFFNSLSCNGETTWLADVVGENGTFAGGRAVVSVTAFAFAEGESDFAEASGTVVLKGARPPPTASCPRSGNDGFELGVVDTNVIPCWTVVDQEGGSGSWCSQTGAVPPQGDCLGSFGPVAAPPEGLQAAMTNQGGLGSHVLYRCGVLRSGSISFQLQINNQFVSFFSPPSLDFKVFPNQQFRADLLTAEGVAADPFTVAPANVLLNLYQTLPGDPALSGYGTVTADASAYVGQEVCLRFVEVDNQFFFNVGVDDVKIDLRRQR